jgi:hypothetical protein
MVRVHRCPSASGFALVTYDDGVAVPPHRARVIEILTRAGFRNREDHLPTRAAGGTFSVTGGQGVLVTVEWWDATDLKRAELLIRIAGALHRAGLPVEPRGPGKLYVPYVVSG